MADKLLENGRRLGMSHRSQWPQETNVEKRRWSEAGFSLIEMLVVVAILGMIALIMTINVAAALKRGRLEAAANQLRSLVESARLHAAEQGAGVFVVITPNAGGSWAVRLIRDANGDGLLQDPAIGGADVLLQTEGTNVLTNDLLLSPPTPTAPPPTWPGPNNWPQANGGFVLLCSTGGQPFAPGITTALTVPQVISITHSEMANSSLHPRIRYDITVSPLWRTRLDKVLY